MKKQFIVKTPFGIGVATSEEDLKDMLGFVEGLTQEEEEGIPSEMDPNLEALQNLLENGVVVKPKNVECDCENCQHNARVSEEKLAELTELLTSINNLDILRFMEKDAGLHRDASILGKGKDHPQVAHLEKVVSRVQERIAELGNPAQDKDIADPISIIIDKLAGALDKDFKSEVEKIGRPTSELMSDEEILERLSDDIAHVNKISDLTLLQCFREFMTIVLESDDPNKKREAKLLIGKIDERITELTGESEADKVENKTTWGKRNPDLLDLDYVSTTVDIGADMLASIDLGYAVSKEQMTSLVRRSTEILDEYLKSEVELIESEELSREARLDDAPLEDSPAEEPLPTLEEINAMTDYDQVDKLQIGLQAEQWRLSDKKQAIINEIHSEMKHVEELHAAATERKGAILNNKADIARADIAENVKALQEAITRAEEHLLIHEDIHESMEILMERYRK